jgi:SagB-type dehydrogenase family enzyme
MFSDDYPVAWSFHKNTCRWLRNIPPLRTDALAEIVPYKEYQNVPLFPLPSVSSPRMSIAEIVEKRHSCRDFANASINLSDLSVLLNGSYGVKGTKTFETIEFFERPIPSGGGLYPLELYLVVNKVENIPQGVYHYAIYPPVLEQIYPLAFSKLYMSQLFMNQPYVAESSAVLIATSYVERNMHKYGDRGYRYILFEAGHLFHHINLLATALGMGTLNLGGFFDDEVANLLKINSEDEIPLYAMAIGVPKTSTEKEPSQKPAH